MHIFRLCGQFLGRCHLAFVLLTPAFTSSAIANEMPVFDIEFNDGIVSTRYLEIPANTPVKLVVRNIGTTPIEFESLRLRKEKVIGPGAVSFVVIRKASPGSYPFFDEFHPETTQGVIVAK